MFTRILRISVGKSEMKLAQAGPSATPEASQVSSLEKKAQQALKNVQDYKWNDDIVLKRLLDSLHSANEDFAKENAAKSAQITSLLENDIQAETDITKKTTLQKLLADRKGELKNVEVKKWAAVKDVATKVVTSTNELRKVNSNIDKLANLDGNESIDAGTADIVDEHVLSSTLSRVTEWNDAKLKEVYERVTGKAPTDYNAAEVKEFQSKLRTSLIVLNQLGGGNAGLIALLQGNTKAYMDAVAKKVAANGGKPLEVKIADPKGLSPQMQTILGAVATIGVAVVTRGIVTVGHEAANMNADTFIKRIQDKGLLAQAGGALAWIKDAFMGRKLALTFGKDKMSVDELEAKVVEFAKEVLTLDEKTDVNNIKNPELKKMYPVVLKIAKDAGVDMTNGKEKIQKALIQAYIQDLGSVNQGSDWTFKLGLLFIGANRDNIATTARRTEKSAFTDIERGMTLRTLTSDELVKAGVSITNIGGKWKHTIPKTLQLKGDVAPVPVEVLGQVDLEQSDKVYDMHFSDIDGTYKVTLTERATQPRTGEVVVAKWDVEKVQQSAPKTAVAREKREVIKDNTLAAFLYNDVGHSNPKVFKPLLDAVNARDEAAVKTALEWIKKIKWYTKLATQLEADIANYQTWTTYMYGSRASRNQDNPTQAGADKMRTPDVLRAEERLAKSLGITASSTAEGEFKVDAKGKHEAVQVSNSYPGQAITVSVFATPRGGYHRVDSYDGSIALSQKQVKVGDGEYKNQIIDSIAKSAGKGGITKQVEALNVFLKQHAKSEVTTAQYVQFLKDGNVKSLGVEGLTTQAGKTTQVFEGRSMIAGNVCMNRIHGIAYPLFELESTTPGRTITQQPTGPVATMDYGAAVNVVGVTGAESALGLSQIQLAAKLKQNRNNPPPQQNQPAPNTTPGVIDNGPIQPPTWPNAPVITPPQPAGPGSVTTITPGVPGWAPGPSVATFGPGPANTVTGTAAGATNTVTGTANTVTGATTTWSSSAGTVVTTGPRIK